MDREELYAEVCSKDFLNFSFSGKSYQTQLHESIAKTKELAGVKVEVVSVPGIAGNVRMVWVTHIFGFMGGSLGCAEGEKVARAFEYAREHKLPICVQCKTGGARMQEGTSSLMQMAKVSVAVEALHRDHLPFISVLNDPTYGGVSASYAMQADVRIAVSPSARIGFAGPQVILNTMCEADQGRFDEMCPPDFQSASYVAQYGQLDMVLDDNEDGAAQSQTQVEAVVGRVAALLSGGHRQVQAKDPHGDGWIAPTEKDMSAPFNYTQSRTITRPQTQDIANEVFDNFMELFGDGKVGRDSCIRGGIASFEGMDDHPCVVIGTYKGHTPHDMQDSNYGMASPHGYRTALRLMQMAERFGLPVVTLVDTVGAWPTFECERDGQSEAIATNLTAMSGLRVPIVTLLVGEGGSGGALGIGMGNSIGMLSGGYFGVISPEGAASILGRYRDDVHKAIQFPKDCQELAVAQCIYANQLKEMGVVDEIIWELAEDSGGGGESFRSFPVLKSRIRAFLISTLSVLLAMSPDQLVAQRYQKFRSMGMYDEILTADGRSQAVRDAEARQTVGSSSGQKPRARRAECGGASKVIQHLAEETMSGTWSRYRKAAPATVPTEAPAPPPRGVDFAAARSCVNAKSVLDSQGPAALALWVREQTRTLITDTSMRDAHQSLLATRVRTEDIVKAAHCASDALKTAFSLECWGGATFDVTMRFLDECPWKRLREIRAACPNVCLQMLLRGSNAVGYTSYPDNVVAEFVRLAALNGIDVFRIFDCFNDVDSMKVSIDSVVAAGKVAEVAVCYTGNLLTSDIYNVDYYKDVAVRAVQAGAHIIGIKDMAGLLRPNEAGILVKALREVLPSSMPIHFHTHSTSSGAIATCMEMARHGCDIIDVCTASMADGTSQPSMNAFVAMMDGCSNETGINYLDLEPYDMYWARVRLMYAPFESGMLSGSARVYEHQIPGGQYSNLLVQCHSMGLWDRWEEVLDAYRDCNRVLGDIVKVTPSSKCVGDLALYLVTRKVSAADLLDPAKASSIDFPESVVGLMRGDLGFPHRGFPEAVEKAVLRGAPKRTIRAGITLPPEDLSANIQTLSAKWGVDISEEQAMSSLMYPKVFSDFMARQQSKGGDILRHLPTPVYLYGMVPGQKFVMSVPSKSVREEAEGVQPALLAAGTGPVEDGTAEFSQVTVKLERITPLKSGHRDLIFTVNGQTQVATVRDTSGVFVFDGPMAAAGDATQLGSPMPGVVEKLLVAEGQWVAAGDTLCTVSAMKMEVKVTAPADGQIASIHVQVGARVVDGALLLCMK